MEKLPSLADFLGVPDPIPSGAPDVPPLSAKFTARDFCRGVLNSPEYRQSLRNRIILGELPSAIECMIWDRAAGKVVEKVEIKDMTDPLDDCSVEQLEDRALRLLAIARQLRVAEESEPASEPEGAVH